jgi:predicted dehydrogenase
VLQKAAATSKGNLYVRHNRRFDPDFLHIKEIMESGLLGSIHTIKLSRLGYSRRSDWQTLKQNGGGQLLNWGPHLIDHALQFIGASQKPLKNIWSDCKRLIAGGDCEDHVKVILKSADDCIVDIEISGAAMISVPEYVILGTRGSLVLSLNDGKIELNYIDPLVELNEIKVNNGVPDGYNTSTKSDTLKWVHKTVEINPQNIADFWDALHAALTNKIEFPVTLEQAVEVMRIISVIKQQTNY